MDQLVLATSNSGKIQELQDLLAPVQCLSQADFGVRSPKETGLSFIENAILKARYASKISGLPALADDSGLVVPALNGQPGIYSARFAGEQATDEDNCNLLLSRLTGVESSNRHAYFYCAVALVQLDDDPTPLCTFGRMDGIITTTPLGTLGFGYDPVFYLPEHQVTMAQLPRTVKNTLSHRAAALKQLKAFITLKNE